MDLDRNPTCEEIKAEIGWCKGSVKRRGGSTGTLESSPTGTASCFWSSPSLSYEVTVNMNLGKRLGGVEDVL